MSLSSFKNRLLMQPVVKKALGNVGWLAFDKFFRLLLGLFVSIFTARYLGSHNYGLLAYAMSYVTLFAGFASLGLNGIVARDLITESDRASEILGSAIGLRFVVGCLFFLIAVFLSDYINHENDEIRFLVFILAFSLIVHTGEIFKFWFESRVESSYIVIVETTVFTIFSVFRILLVIFKQSVTFFAITYLVEMISSNFGIVFLYSIRIASLGTLKFSCERAKQLLCNSWPLLFSSGFVLLNMHIDSIMLGRISSISEVGFYSVATRFTGMWYFLPVIVGASFSPMLTRLYSENRLSYVKKAQQVFALVNFFAIAGVLLTFFLGDYIVFVLFGEEFARSAVILSIHIWTAIFVFHVSIRTRLLIIENDQKYVTIFSGLTLITNVCFNYFMIPIYGSTGAAVASLLSWGLCTLIIPLFFRKTISFPLTFVKSLFYPFMK